MKQVFRRVIDRSGKIVIDDLPKPVCGDNQVLVSTEYSLISSGTELSTLKKTPAALVKQTIEDPWMRSAVMNTVKSGGMETTYNRIMDELFLYRVIGYSGVGKVLEIGKNIDAVVPGDRVAFAAQGHAEIVAPFKNHIVKVPDAVDPRAAAFVTVGGIAIQGIRRAEANFGEYVAVIGLGLVGQIAAQVLLAAGMRVIGIDISPARLELAKSLGVQNVVNPADGDPIAAVKSIANGKGADRVIICAASKESTIANQAMQMCRKQGRVVAVGIVKMDLERMPFFRNELDFVFSRAYGPGSYNDDYEKGRTDFPYEYVRWTEQRNLAEFIRLVEEKRINIEPLIDRDFSLDEVQGAFDQIKAGKLKKVAALIKYDASEDAAVTIKKSEKPATEKKITLGVIGTGNHSRGIMLPLIKKQADVGIKALCSATGATAGSVSKKYSVDYITSDYKEIIADKSINAVYVATRHNMHAEIVIAALKAGKHVLVEKPLAMTLEELDEIKAAAAEQNLICAVCHNRRYSSVFREMCDMAPDGPKIMRFTAAVGRIPDNHWTLDSIEGGGRLIGEADHFFDMFNAVCKSAPIDIDAFSLSVDNKEKDNLFNFTVQVSYEDGSLAQLVYTGLGHSSLPREEIEVFAENTYLKLTDCKTLEAPGKLKKPKKLLTGDMGHAQMIKDFCAAVKGEENGLASFEEGWNATYIAAYAQRKISERNQVHAKSVAA